MNRPVHIGIPFIASSVLLLVFTSPSFAKVTVDIKNSAEGSSSNVDINSNQNVSVSKSSTSNVHTNIQIETNGEVKTYESNKNGDITIQSKDGSSKVHVSTNSDSTPTITPQPTVSPTPTKTDINKKFEQKKERRKSFIHKFFEEHFPFFLLFR